MPKDPTPPVKSGDVLDFEALRAACADARARERHTQAEVAALVFEASDDRDRPPSVSAISNAEREAGGHVAALQMEILAVLDRATFTGPLYRVD